MNWLNYEKMKVLLSVFVAAIMLYGGSAKADYAFGKPVNLGSSINSSSDEFAPWISTDGLSLLFASPSGGQTYEILLSTRPTTQDFWNTPVSVAVINGIDPVVLPRSISTIPGVTTSDGLELYFDAPGPDAFGAYDLYVSQRETIDADWGAPENLGPVVNSSADEISPTISPDGLELYFSGYTGNARPDGYGRGDLWVTTRASRNDTWTEPVNLGQTVNTANQDARPRISADGLVLFFDSQRNGGHGSADIYMMQRATLLDPWEEPVNLGPIINSSAFDECAFPSADGSSLLFDSPKPGSYGGHDIWQAPIIPIVDFNGDGVVDDGDLDILNSFMGTDESLCDIGPMPWGDGIVDAQDLTVFAEYLYTYPDAIAYWKLDETEGDVAYDSIGDYDGQLYGDPVWRPIDGIVDGALLLDGIDDCVGTWEIPGLSEGDFSMFAWIKGGAPGQVVLSEFHGVNWLMADSNQGYLKTDLTCTSGRLAGQSLVSDVTITDGNWHRVGLTWDGTNRTLYVDDVVVASDIQGKLARSVVELNIGCGPYETQGTFFSGMIDDVRIYNRVITP